MCGPWARTKVFDASFLHSWGLRSGIFHFIWNFSAPKSRSFNLHIFCGPCFLRFTHFKNWRAVWLTHQNGLIDWLEGRWLTDGVYDKLRWRFVCSKRPTPWSPSSYIVLIAVYAAETVLLAISDLFTELPNTIKDSLTRCYFECCQLSGLLGRLFDFRVTRSLPIKHICGLQWEHRGNFF